MRTLVPVFAACLVAGGAAPAAAQSVKVGYGISLAGIPLGTADLATDFDGSRYKLQVGAKLTGFMGAVTGGKGAATATGAIGSDRPLPASFALTSRSSSEERTVRMGLSGGTVSALDITPPIEEKPDRVPLTDSHKRGVTDPVSALLMPVKGASATDPENCNRTIPVFDGAARFDVVLSFASTKTAEMPGYRGPVLVCSARYVPIAGHRAMRPATKFMEENRDMQVWLAPVPGGKVLVPLRIAVQTMIGMSVIEASKVALRDEAKLPSASTAAKANAGQ